MLNIYEEKIKNLDIFLENFEKLSSSIDINKQDIFDNYHQKIKQLILDIKNGENEKINISIVANYSCGKTTIVRGLTGNKELKVGVAPETDTITQIEWGNNAIISDTPGFNSGNIEHDNITRNYVFKSDIIIYVITMGELFQDNGQAFKEICETLGNEDKDNIILLVNKLSNKGEKNIEGTLETINKVLSPYNSNDFSTCFIDALDYEKGIDNNQEIYIKRSKFYDFENLLNKKLQKTDKINSLINSIKGMKKILSDFVLEYNTEDDEFKKVIFNNKKILEDLESIKQEKENKFYQILNDEIRNIKQDISFKIDEEIQEINQEGINNLEIFIKNEIHTQINEIFTPKVNELLIDMGNDFENTLDNFQNKFYLEAVEYSDDVISNDLIKGKMIEVASIFKTKESVLNIGRGIRYTFGKEAGKSAYKVIGPLSKVASIIAIGLEIYNEYKYYEHKKVLNKFKYDLKNNARSILDQKKEKVFELFYEELLDGLNTFDYTNIKNTLKEYKKSIYSKTQLSKEVEKLQGYLDDLIMNHTL